MTSSFHSKNYATLIKILVKARKDKGIKQQVVADKLGKPQSYIAKIEGGERRLDLVEFTELANAMDYDPITLFQQWLKIK